MIAANPARAITLALMFALLAGLGISRLQLAHVRAQLSAAVAARDQAQAEARACSAGVADMERAAALAAQNARRAVEAARATSAARQPQIVALAAAEQASGSLTCADAVERVRDALQ